MVRSNAIARLGVGLLRVRWFVRAPIWIYRGRLGFLFGSRLLMLEHLGRKSGRRRYVVLEVIEHPAPGRFVVVSGFGRHAQWFRNIEANPRVRVWVAHRAPVTATAHRLGQEAASRALAGYAGAHPRAWARLRPVLEETLGARIDERGKDLPVVAIDLIG